MRTGREKITVFMAIFLFLQEIIITMELIFTIFLFWVRYQWGAKNGRYKKTRLLIQVLKMPIVK